MDEMFFIRAGYEDDILCLIDDREGHSRVALDVRATKIISAAIKESKKGTPDIQGALVKEVLELVDHQDEITRSDLQGLVTVIIRKAFNGGSLSGSDC